jgi:hypothetical protein
LTVATDVWHLAIVRDMRLFLTFLAAAVLALTGAGCGGDDEKSGTNGDRAQATETTGSTSTSTDTTTPKAQVRTSQQTTKPDPARTSKTPKSATVTTPPPGPPPPTGSAADRKAVSVSVTTFYDALATGKGVKACSLMTASIRARFTRELAKLRRDPNATCAQLAEVVSKAYPAKLRGSLTQLKVTRVDVEGDKATAFYELPGIPKSHLPVVRQGGVWKVGAPVSPPSG